MVDSSYYVVVIPASEPAYVLLCESADEAATVAKDTAQTGGQIFFFRGVRLRVTSGPLRHLVTESGREIPLFEVPRGVQYDDSGFVGETGEVSPEYARALATLAAQPEIPSAPVESPIVEEELPSS